jgi:hypothetical protein
MGRGVVVRSRRRLRMRKMGSRCLPLPTVASRPAAFADDFSGGITCACGSAGGVVNILATAELDCLFA